MEADTIKEVEMKDKIQKEYLRRTRKLLETNLSGRNLFKGINTWAVPSLDTRDPFSSEPEKQIYGHFKRLINNISHDKTWTWLREGNIKRETESLLMAAQNSAIGTNHIKTWIDETQQSKCGLCGDRYETTNHIISGCSKLAKKEFKARHDWVSKVINREMCKKFKFDHASKCICTTQHLS